MSTITKYFRIDDTLTDMTSVMLSDTTATYGVKRNDTDAVVVADGTAMTQLSTGVYSHTFTDPADDLTYTYALEVVYAGETYWVTDTFVGPTSSTDLTSTANVKSYLGITSTDYDTIIGNLVTRASRAIETYCNRTFNSTAYINERHSGGSDLIYVKNYPIISLSRVAVGTRNVLQITHSDSSAASATINISSTGITLTTHGGSNDGDVTAAFATYTTLSTLATQINTSSTWTAETLSSDYDNMASTDLIQIGAIESLNAITAVCTPDERLSDIGLDLSTGAIYRTSGFPDNWHNVYVDYTGGYATIPADLEQIAIDVVAEVFNLRNTNTALKSEKIGDYAYTNFDSQNLRSAIMNHSDDLALWRRHIYV